MKMKNKLLFFISTFLCFLFINNLHSQTTWVWLGTSSSNWSDPDNWYDINLIQTGPPIAGDTVIFDINGNGNNCDMNVNIPGLGKIDIQSSYTSTITQNSDIIVGSLANPIKTFIMANGVFTGGDSTFFANNFTQSGGTFTKPSDHMRINNNFTISGTANFNGSTGRLELQGGFIQTGGTFAQAADTLEVTGNFTVSGTASFNGNTGSLTLSGNYSQTGGTFTKSSNTMQVNTDFMLSGSGVFNGNTGALNITGNLSQTGGTLSQSSSTMQVNGNFTKSGNGTFNGNTGTLDITGEYTQTGGTFTKSSNTMEVTDDFNISDSAVFNGNSGTLTLTGAFIQSGGTFTQGSNTMQVNGNITVSGSADFNGNTGTLTVTGIFSQSGGTFTKCSNTMQVNGNFTISDTANFNGNTGTLDLVGGYNQTGGTFTSTTSTLVLKANYNSTGGTFNHNSGTVQCQSNNLSLNNTPVFHILILLNSSGNQTRTFTIGNSITVDSILSINTGIITGGVRPIIINGGTINVLGNITLNYHISEAPTTGGGTATIRLNGSSDQTFFIARTTTNYPNANVLPLPNIEITGVSRNIILEASNKFICIDSLSTFSITGSGNININTGIVNVKGNINITNTGTTGGGTAELRMTGSSTVSLSGTSSAGEGLLPPNFIINKPSGAVNMSNHISLSGGTWTHSDGTINPGSSTVNFYGTSSITGAGRKTFGNLNIASGALTVPADTVFVSGNWTNNGTFTHNSGIINFNGSGAIMGSSSNTFNDLIISQNLTGPENGTITVIGDLIHTGNFSPNGSTVVMNGTSNQEIGGSSTITFKNLTVQNSSICVMETSANIEGTVNLTGTATFDADGAANNKAFTLTSSLISTGSIGTLTTPANFTGNITIQRLVPYGTTGWAFLGSPINGATLSHWSDDFIMTGFPNSDYPSYSFISAYQYDQSFDACEDKYIAATDISDGIAMGESWWIYLGTNPNNPVDILIDITGDFYKGDIELPVSYNVTSIDSCQGWNLISNPYPSAIDWDHADWDTLDIFNAIYTYNADLDGYASYVAGASSPAVGSGGINNIIPSMQGFYVRTINADLVNPPLLRAKETVKVSNNPTFRSGNSFASDYPMFRLFVDGENKHDETYFRFMAETTEKFDGNYDGYKLMSNDPNASNICSKIDDNLFSINSMPELNKNYSIPVRLSVGITGNYTISLNDVQNFSGDACISIEDLLTDSITNLTLSNYSFSISDTTDAPRFIIHISAPVTATVEKEDATCFGFNDGISIAAPEGLGPFTFIWRDHLGQIIKTSTDRIGNDTLSNLGSGTYSVNISTPGACGNHHQYFTITSQNKVEAAFNMSSDSVDMFTGSYIEFYNNSIEATDFIWDFGDNSPANTAANPTHNYNSAGNYTVRLIVENDNCSSADTTSHPLIVTNSTSINESLKDNDVKILSNSNGIFIQFSLSHPQNTVITVYNMIGQSMIEPVEIKAFNQIVKLDIPQDKISTYFIHISNAEKSISKKIIR